MIATPQVTVLHYIFHSVPVIQPASSSHFLLPTIRVCLLFPQNTGGVVFCQRHGEGFYR